MELESVAFAPVAVVEEVVSLFAQRAADKGLTLQTSLPAAPAPALLGDPTRLRQVLANLLSNAVKFTAEGKICIDVDIQPSSESRSSGHTLQIAVRDQGVGMTAEVQQRLFEAFMQGDSSTNRRFGGTGLGMAITQRIIDAMHGEMRVDSEPNVGSTFTVTIVLPEAPMAAVTTLRLQAVDQDISKYHLLIAEDNEINQQLIARLIERFGCTCQVVPDGAAARSNANRRVRSSLDGLSDAQI